MTISTPTHAVSGHIDEPWFREEHVLFREQVRRFVEEEVKPKQESGGLPSDPKQA